MIENKVSEAAEAYHRWYYDTRVWRTVSFLGVPCQKSVSDLWNYQEIIFQLKPSLIAEFGVNKGGSSLYFAEIANLVTPGCRVLSVDINLQNLDPRAAGHPRIRFVEANTADAKIASLITEMRHGPVFFILDSDHRKAHVLAELKLVRTVTEPGDYVIVEDGNVNGHPVLPEWGPGPLEAVQEYMNEYPDDYLQDKEREQKFGFTFAPDGFLIRK
jgi:cephalosporin hydroxylase